MGRIHEDHATSPVHPGVSQHESGSSQSAQPGDRVRMNATPGGSPVIGSKWTLHQKVVQDLLHQ